MLFLYSDDGLHSKHNEIPHKMTCGLVNLFKGGGLIDVKITKKDKHSTAKGRLQPLNKDGRLIQVTKVAA